MKKMFAAAIITVSIGAASATALAAGGGDTDSAAGDSATTSSVSNTPGDDAVADRGCDRRRGTRRHRVAKAMAKAAAEAIGITPEELRSELDDGESVADVASAHGVDAADVEAALLADVTEHVNRAVAKGRLDPERATEILDHAPDRIHEFVTKARHRPSESDAEAS
jgi:hypothetical protein